jgi:hypothetical protein
LTHKEVNESIDHAIDDEDENMTVLEKIIRFFRLFSIKRVIPFNSLFRWYWDVAIIAFALWVCFTTPLDIAFEPMTFRYKNTIAFNEFIDVMFIADIFLNFRTTISDFITGDEVTDSKQIAMKYLKGQFIFDLIAAIPMDLILAPNKGLGEDYAGGSSGGHRILGGSATAASA